MSTEIHYGGGVGTYKSYSAIQRYGIPQLQKGRTVISSIRGFDSIRVIESVMGIEIPKSAELIFVDLETIEGIAKLRRWWEWAPVGAFIIIDEAQLVYPKSIKLKEYDYLPRDGMTSEETALEDKKHNGFLHAFTMHRHSEWDLVILTPSIKMLLPEITGVTETAYEHKNTSGLLPWKKNCWREIKHAPTERASSSPYPPQNYKADKRIYSVYKSTKSGSHSDGNSNKSIFTNPKVVMVLLIPLVATIAFFYLLFFQILAKDDVQVIQENQLSDVQVSTIAGSDNVIIRNDDTAGNVQPVLDKTKAIETTSFTSTTMAIVGKFFDEYTIEVGIPPNATQFSTSYLYKNGVKLNIINDCLIEMTFDNVLYNVRCPLHQRKFKSPKHKSKSIEIKPFAALTGA